jgi:MoaA/NifB/PqqE/SkfB family radical SAM enzyme
MDYDFSHGKAPLPESVTLFMTHKCNLRCKMCGQWGDKGVTRAAGNESIGNEMSYDELKGLVDQLAVFKTNITLFGGEPLLHRDFIELIRYIKSKGLHCLVITNGSLLKPVAEQLVESGIDELNLSLDGYGSTHDTIRGIDGLFKRITEGITAVNEAKIKLHTSKPLINLQCTINKDNYQCLPELLDAARLFKAHSLTFHHLIYLNDSVYAAQQSCLCEHLPGTGSEGWKGFIFDPGMDVEKLISALTSITSIKTDFFVNVYPNFSNEEIRAYYRDPSIVPASYRPRCVSPWIVAYIFPDGAVRPCLNLDYQFGNTRTSPVHEIWNSEPAIRYRMALKRNKIFPACTRCTELFRY